MGFKVGQSVVAQGQSGRVVYQRMAGPDYKVVQAVCVYLDSKINQPCYCGTLFAVKDVTPTSEGWHEDFELESRRHLAAMETPQS